MLIGVSTGVLFGHKNDRNEQIRFLRESRIMIDGLEVLFSSPKELEGFKLTKENEKYARTLKFCSLHLPWKDVVYSKKENPIIKMLSELYLSLGAKNAVIHPDCIENPATYEFMQQFFPNLSVENMTPRKPVGYSIEEIRKITDCNGKLGVVLDFAHCMESKESFEMYEKAFFQKISEIHISASKRALYGDETGSSHIALHKTEILPQIRKRNVPFIIEGKVSTAEELEKEIDFVRRFEAIKHPFIQVYPQ